MTTNPNNTTDDNLPDMTLYEEIVFLQYYAGDVKWIVENEEVVGTAGIDKSWYNDDEYCILTVICNP